MGDAFRLTKQVFAFSERDFGGVVMSRCIAVKLRNAQAQGLDFTLQYVVLGARIPLDYGAGLPATAVVRIAVLIV